MTEDRPVGGLPCQKGLIAQENIARVIAPSCVLVGVGVLYDLPLFPC